MVITQTDVTSNIKSYMMKKIFIILFIISTIFVSCNSKTIEIENLKSENELLKDSIHKLNFKILQNLKLYTIIDKSENINGSLIKGKFQYFNYLSNYKVFVSNNLKSEKRLVYEGNDPEFEFNYIPKSTKDSILQITMESKADNKAIILVSKLELNHN